MKIIKNIYVLIILSLICLPSCRKDAAEEQKVEEQKQAEVSLVSPVIKTITEYVTLNAVTAFQDQEIVRAIFAGYIVKCCKKPGDHISKGDLLFIVKTKESSALDSSDVGLSSKFSGNVKVYAQTSGVLSELNFQAGNFVAEGDRLANIVDPHSLKIIWNVPFNYAFLVKISATYTVNLPDGRTLQAKVIKKMPSIDAASQTQSFILEPVSNIELPANLNINLKLPVKQTQNAIVLPKSSVVSNETQTEFWVMKAVNSKLAVKQGIKKGIEADGMVEILQPHFNPDDRFILSGAYGLPDTVNIMIKK